MQQPILSKVLSDIELRNYSEATKDLYMRTCARYLVFLGDKPLGVTRVVAAFSVRSGRGQASGSGWVFQVLLGVLIAVLGILCIINPLSVAVGVGMMLGISIVVVGVDIVIAGFLV